MNKFHAQKAEASLIDGTRFTFDSKREYRRYKELCILLRSGIISDLQLQVPFELIPKQKKSDGKCERSAKYVADFVYNKDGKIVVEDAKGYRDGQAYALFVLKRKLMLERHGIEVIEV